MGIDYLLFFLFLFFSLSLHFYRNFRIEPEKKGECIIEKQNLLAVIALV